MTWFGRKEPPASARASARPSPAPAVRPPTRAVSPGTSDAPLRSPSGTSAGQAVKGSQILAVAEATRATAQTAVNLLESMVQPTPGEASSLDEVKALLADMTALLVRIDTRLSAVESRLPAPRVVSLR